MAKLIVPQEIKNDPLIHRRINKTAVNTESIEAMTPETDKKVEGTFVNIEAPGMTQKFCAKFYKGMQYFCEVLHDNERYVIPLSVARYINERWAYEKHDYIQDEKGNPVKENKKTARGKFLIERYL